MKVLYFIESLRAGGKERRIVELLKAFKQNYPDVEIALVLTRKEIHYQEIYELHIPIYFIERWLIKKDPSVLLRFYLLAKKIKPDIIHAWGHMVAFYAVPAKKLLGIPMINNEIADATASNKLIGKQWVFNASERIIANTKAGLLAYEAPPTKSAVIYNGFNFDRLKNIAKPEEIRERFKIATKWIIGMVASFSDYKDYATYLEAAMIAFQQNADITFLCVGDGDDSVLKNKFQDSRIRFLGKQSQVESIMNVCHVGVLATNSKNHAEGISNSLLEFMALGKPVIATNSGGSVELVIEGETGFLVEAFDSKALAEKISYLISNPNQQQYMGEQARRRVEENFSIENMSTSFYKEYQSVLPKR
jgi:glycosyltransferase involved in cell wall biosynthesis